MPHGHGPQWGVVGDLVAGHIDRLLGVGGAHDLADFLVGHAGVLDPDDGADFGVDRDIVERHAAVLVELGIDCLNDGVFCVQTDFNIGIRDCGSIWGALHRLDRQRSGCRLGVLGGWGGGGGCPHTVGQEHWQESNDEGVSPEVHTCLPDRSFWRVIWWHA